MSIKVKIPLQEIKGGKPVFEKDGKTPKLVEQTGDDMEILERDDNKWSVYKLEDGTTIKVKFTAVQIIKMDKLDDATKKPIYSIQGRQDIIVLPKIKE
ncbi:MAG TPA: hypothetical protein VLL98_04110 [Rickettsiales bacterium]|nr:hypothetical protein [Rickettsiales bacterium]